MTTYFEGIFRDCYKRATKTRIEGKDFFHSFYDRFTSTSNEIRAKIDVIVLSELKKVLRRSLLETILFFSTRTSTREFERIAAIRGKMEDNVHPDLYIFWTLALIKTVREYDLEMTKEVELAWRIVAAPAVEIMKFRYDQLTPAIF